MIARSNGSYEAQKATHLRQIAKYNRNRKPTNTQWTDRQIDRQQRKIEPIEAERISRATSLTAEKREALNKLRERRELKEDRAQLAADTAKAIVITGTSKKNGNIEAVTNVLIGQLSGIAGKSIFILIALAIVREILRNRNGIEPVPVFTEFDFGGNPIAETIMYLPTKFGRYILRNVREGYEKIRAKGMPSPERPGTLYDWTTANNDIKAFEQPDDDPDGTNMTASSSQSKPSTKRKKRRPSNRNKANSMTKNQSRPIGFRTGYSENKSTAQAQSSTTAAHDDTKANNGPVSDTSDKIVYKEVDTSLRECLTCGETYKPKAHNQKFCGRRCKDQHHREKHDGKEFNPGIYRGNIGVKWGLMLLNVHFGRENRNYHYRSSVCQLRLRRLDTLLILLVKCLFY